MSADTRKTLVRIVGEDNNHVSLGDVAHVLRRVCTSLEHTTDFDATVPAFRAFNVADAIDRLLEDVAE